MASWTVSLAFLEADHRNVAESSSHCLCKAYKMNMLGLLNGSPPSAQCRHSLPVKAAGGARLCTRQQCRQPKCMPNCSGHKRGRLDVSCMAQPRRQAKVARQIEREVGSLLVHDEVLQSAVCPERHRGKDFSMSAIASVTEVELSKDLQVAKVYISIFSNSDAAKVLAVNSLKKLQGYVRTQIAHNMNLRLAPEIRFLEDEAALRGAEVLSILDKLRADRGEEDSPEDLERKELAALSSQAFVMAREGRAEAEEQTDVEGSRDEDEDFDEEEGVEDDSDEDPQDAAAAFFEQQLNSQRGVRRHPERVNRQ